MFFDSCFLGVFFWKKQDHFQPFNSTFNEWTELRNMMSNRSPALECGSRQSLWYDSVQYLQNQRGKNQEIPPALQSRLFICGWKEMKMTYCHHLFKSPPISTRWPTTSTLRPLPAQASLSWLWWVLVAQSVWLFPQCGDTIVQWLMWRSECRQQGISGVHDWWPAYCCSLFHRLSWHKHHNNAKMSWI